jgi:hypothetical protein
LTHISRELRRLFRETVWLVDEETLKLQAAISLLLDWPQPHWITSGGECCVKVPHGLLEARPYRKLPRLGYTASRDGVLLVAGDGRDAVFKRRRDAQTALLLHAKDGYEGAVDVADNLVGRLMMVCVISLNRNTTQRLLPRVIPRPYRERLERCL